jgi:hypothetical protein
MNQRRGFVQDQAGGMAVTVAVCLTMLLAGAALAVDYGRLGWVQTELKAAADAGALAGARFLMPYVGSPASPNWVAGSARATQTVLLNRADGAPLTDCDVDYGYWSLVTKTFQSPGISPTTSDLPAIRVQVTKAEGHNGGALPMFFARIFGVSARDLGAQAVAVISFPNGVKGGALKPLAATKTIVDNYWNAYDPLNPGQPFKFKIGEESSDPSINDTMWTTFKVDVESNDYTKQLINNGNPDPLAIGESIHLQPGVRAVDYGPNEMGQFINQTVVLPIVAPDTLVAKTMAPVLGFIAFHITGYSQSSKYIEGYFDKEYVVTNPQGIGTSAYSKSNPNPPKLVN